MTTDISNILHYCALALIMISIALCFIRMMLGPRLSDRVLALDLTANVLISFIAIYSIITDEPIYIDVVIALALIIFLTTVAFAHLMTGQSTKQKKIN